MILLPLRLALGDLRAGLGRFVVFILCLALGIMAMAAVDTVSRGIRDALHDDGRAILGGDFALRSVYVPATAQQLAELQAIGTVGETATMRAMAVAGDASVLVEAKAVDTAYPLYGTIDLGTGTLAGDLADDGAVVDADLLDRLGVGIGATIQVAGHPFTLSGTIVREPDRAGETGFVLGPRLMMSRRAFDAAGFAQPGSLVYWNYDIRLPPGADAEQAESELQKIAAADGWQLRTPEDAAQTLRHMIDRLTQFLTLVSVSALAVGGIGIANASKAALETRLHAIAVMKCLGASRRMVFTVYLLQTLAVAAIGIVLGLLAGTVVPIVLQPVLAAALPITPQLHPQPVSLAFAALYGVLIVLIFTLPTLWQAGIVSPVRLFRSRHASLPFHLDERHLAMMAGFVGVFVVVLVWRSSDTRLTVWFLGSLMLMMTLFHGIGGWIMRAAAWAGRRGSGGMGLRMALGNLHRPGNRTRDIVVSLGMGLAVLIAIGLVEANFRHELDARVADEAPSFFFIDIQKADFEDFRNSLMQIPGTSGFAATPSLRGRIVAVNGQPAEAMLKDRAFAWVLGSDRGITYSADLPAGSRLLEGKWWDAQPGEPLLSITDGVARAFALHPGDTMTVGIAGREITAKIANVRAVDWGTFNINFTLVFSPGVLESAPQTWLATVRADDAGRTAIIRDVAHDFPGVNVVDVRAVLATLTQIMDKIAAAIRIAALMILVTGLLVLVGAITAGFERRVGDAVVMKVLGATRGRLFAIFLVEFGILGLAAALAALLFGTVSAWLLTRHVFDLAWHLYPRPPLVAVLLGIGATMSIGFGATLIALGRKSAPYLRAA
jgi:putative ABC transport system permease protein